MRFYISADIEGVTGINSWSETNKGTPDYSEFQTQMTREVVAACDSMLSLLSAITPLRALMTILLRILCHLK